MPGRSAALAADPCVGPTEEPWCAVLMGDLQLRSLGTALVAVASLGLGAGALWYLADPSPGQVYAVTAPLVRLPLHSVPIKQSFAVPDDLAWRRVRLQWGEPHFYLVAVTSDYGGRRLCSQDEAPVAATVTVAGEATTLSSCGTGWPYRYSVLTRDPWCYRFKAALGARGKVKADVRHSSSCELVLVSTYATKDRLVGVALHEEFDRYVNATALSCAMLGLVGVALVRVGRKRRNTNRSLEVRTGRDTGPASGPTTR
jgi:hypothetical protein